MWPGTNDPGNWCCEQWCYVDSQCPTALPSWQNGSATPLFWSYLACDADRNLTAATSATPASAVAVAATAAADTCKWEPEVACGCSGSNVGFPFTEAPLYSNATLFPTDYGTACKAWETDRCSEMWPANDNVGDWCCQNWCYVAETCPLAQRSWSQANLWWTWKSCDTPVAQIDTCTWTGFYNRTATQTPAQLTAAAAGEIGVVAFDSGTSAGKITRSFVFPLHGFDVTTSGDNAYVPVLLRSPLVSTPKIYSLKIKAANGTSLLPDFLAGPVSPATFFQMRAYDGTTKAGSNGFLVNSLSSRRSLQQSGGGAGEPAEEEWDMSDADEATNTASDWLSHGRNLLGRSGGGSRGGSSSGSRSRSSSRSYSSRSPSPASYYTPRMPTTSTPPASRSSFSSRGSSSSSSSRGSGFSSSFPSSPSSYRSAPASTPSAFNSPSYSGPVRNSGSTSNYNSRYQTTRTNNNGYRYAASGSSAVGKRPSALVYAAGGAFAGAGVAAFYYGNYGNSDRRRQSYYDRGYGVPLRTGTRPGDGGKNWFEGDMSVGDYGYSGLGFRGASRTAPFDKLFVNFADNAGTCSFTAANAAAVAAAATTSHACKLRADACAQWNGTDPRWCAAASYVKGAARPTFPAVGGSVTLQAHVTGYLDCINEVAGKKLLSCPISATADYMLDAFFAFGVISQLDAAAFPITVELELDPGTLTRTDAGQPNLMFTFLKAATVGTATVNPKY